VVLLRSSPAPTNRAPPIVQEARLTLWGVSFSRPFSRSSSRLQQWPHPRPLRPPPHRPGQRQAGSRPSWRRRSWPSAAGRVSPYTPWSSASCR